MRIFPIEWIFSILPPNDSQDPAQITAAVGMGALRALVMICVPVGVGALFDFQFGMFVGKIVGLVIGMLVGGIWFVRFAQRITPAGKRSAKEIPWEEPASESTEADELPAVKPRRSGVDDSRDGAGPRG